jgi:folate-binding protein YgfZ
MSLTASPDSPHFSAAAPGAAAGNRWQIAAADASALAAGPVLAVLDDHAVLDFSGPDAAPFLQGQTTVDIVAMAPGRAQLGAYCTPKGRLLAIFQVWRHAQGLGMLLPAAIAPSIARRLGMFVLRAKVQIRDASADWTALALMGPGAQAALARAGIDAPGQAWESRALADGECLIRQPEAPGCAERFVFVVPSGRVAHWRQALGQFAPASPALWWWSQIAAAVPAIVTETQELFVPQSLNLEVLGGINFRKGCYPGQEIVARSQYLGKLRRRMFLAHAAAVGAGADIFADGNSEAIGRLVLAASAPDGGWDVLFECPTDRAHAAVLHAGASDAPVLQLRALPYALFDPTA